jgi:hypothetical protein
MDYRSTNNLISGYKNQIGDNKLFNNNMVRKVAEMKINNEFSSHKDIIKKFGDKYVKDLIIKPIEQTKINANEFKSNITEKKNTFKPDLKKYWQERKNKPIQPYKQILVKENLNLLQEKIQKKISIIEKENKKKVDGSDELVVHKVTFEDKDKKKLENEYDNYNKFIEKHNGKLKIIYSLNEKAKHKEKFVHENKYKYRVKYDPKSLEDFKEEKYKFHEKEKNEKENIDDINSKLLEIGFLNNDEIVFDDDSQDKKKLENKEDPKEKFNEDDIPKKFNIKVKTNNSDSENNLNNKILIKNNIDNTNSRLELKNPKTENDNTNSRLELKNSKTENKTDFKFTIKDQISSNDKKINLKEQVLKEHKSTDINSESNINTKIRVKDLSSNNKLVEPKFRIKQSEEEKKIKIKEQNSSNENKKSNIKFNVDKSKDDKIDPNKISINYNENKKIKLKIDNLDEFEDVVDKKNNKKIRFDKDEMEDADIVNKKK